MVGDIVMTRADTFLGWAIRSATRGRGEKRSWVNHVGVIVSGDSLTNAVIVEALHRVEKRHLWGAYAGKETDVAIFRMKDLRDDERAKLSECAERYVGKRYGYAKIGLQWIDSVIGRARGKHTYWFRRLGFIDSMPICSVLVATCFRSIGRSFGVPAEAATPDDIWDWCNDHRRRFEQVLELGPLKAEY